MKYTLEWTENKVTSTGKKMMKVTLKDETGAVTNDVAIWEGFPNFDGLKPGEIVEGDLVVKQNGQYENKSLYAPKVAGTSPQRSTGAIKQAMQTKADNIEKAQGNKEQGIKVASTMSMACQTALAFLQGETIKDEGVFKAEVKRWREFYWKEWDKAEPF